MSLHTIEAFRVETIKSEPVQVPAECPIPSELLAAMLQECPVVASLVPKRQQDIPLPIGTEAREVVGYDSAEIVLAQPSDMHVRSFWMQGEPFTTKWQDRYGNHYGAVTLKGNNFTQARAIKHPTAVNEVVAYGLQESKIIERVLAASRILCGRGVSTERIIGLAEPRTYLYPLLSPDVPYYETVGRTEYTRRIAKNYWQTLPEAEQTLDRLADFTKQFAEMTFFISMRATDTAYRLGDVHFHPESRKAFFEELGATDPMFKDFDGTNKDSIKLYQNFVAIRLARNLARLSEDLKQGFLHEYNITALGGIVDLDSVSGEALGFGDEPITARDRMQDFQEAFWSLAGVGDKRLMSFSPLIKERADLHQFAYVYILETIAVHGLYKAQGVLADMIDHTPPIDESLKWLAARWLTEAYMTVFADGEAYGKPKVYDAFAVAEEANLAEWLASDETLDFARAQLTEKIDLLLEECDFNTQIEQGLDNAVESVMEKLLMPSYTFDMKKMGLEAFSEASQRVIERYFMDTNFPTFMREKWPEIGSKYVELARNVLSTLQEKKGLDPFFDNIPYEGHDIYVESSLPECKVTESMPMEILEKNIHEAVKRGRITIKHVKTDSLAKVEIAPNELILTDVITDGVVGFIKGGKRGERIVFELMPDDIARQISYMLCIFRDAEGKSAKAILCSKSGLARDDESQYVLF